MNAEFGGLRRGVRGLRARLPRGGSAAAFCAVIAASMPCAHAAPTGYTIVDIGASQQPEAVNEGGMVVGATLVDGKFKRAVVYGINGQVLTGRLAVGLGWIYRDILGTKKPAVARA